MSRSAFDAVTDRLIAKARRLGEAAARSRQEPVRAWRDARLVWPLFTPKTLGD